MKFPTDLKDFEAVIGLEIHVQLKTRSKMFTDAPTGFGNPPNSLINAVVLGLPGSLPTLNKGAIEQAIKTGLLFDCTIPDRFQWDRKNYFYPDSPKNYQLTQLDHPVCVGGAVEIELAGPSRNEMGEHKWIGLDHAHLEEDVGKLTHTPGGSLVDYNRAGTPLLEIVTRPDLRSAEEAVALLQSVRMQLSAAGISDCDMEKGQMRCDANVSVRPNGHEGLNPRVEMKNLNSITGVRNAIQFEIQRQSRVYLKGGMVTQETRRWDADAGNTTSLRSKEDAHDYRYFPDPDLLPVEFPRERIEELKSELPERIFAKQRRYMERFAFPYSLTSVICYDPELSCFFEDALTHFNKDPKLLANYIANELQRERANAAGDGLLPIADLSIGPAHLAELARIVSDGTITKQIAKDVFVEMFKTGQMPAEIVQEKNLTAAEDDDDLKKLCEEVIQSNPVAAAQVREGNSKAMNSFIGPIMKASKGTADPQKVRRLLAEILQ